MLSTDKITKIFKIFKNNNPAPTTELIYHSDFELLVAVILSAQATDVMVNKATAKLFTVANTPQQIIKLGLSTLQQYIKSIGLFRTKATNIIKTCVILVEKFNSNIPQTREELESLPGVGRKTANVILNTLWGQPTIAVDTHIFRVANRIGLTKAATPLATERQLLQVIPEKFIKDAHHWLILHGRYVCKASSPACSRCAIMDLCQFDKKLVSSKI
jgi:endonuclease-3